MLIEIWNNYLIHILDILIVAYLIYQILLLIENTRAMQMVFGLIIIFLLTTISKQLIHLTTLNWLLEKFWLIGVLIIVVVFQPELRAVLAQFGKQPLSKIYSFHEMKFMEEILSAIKEFKETKTGVLIVLQQKIGLKDFIKTGAVLNADISKELLLCIFNQHSILHDGAVILNTTKILAAGCILPLSTKEDLEKYFGTRHRAAIGITEISDAAVIVVSEETGNICFVENGKLEYNIDIQTLNKKLSQLYVFKKI